MSGSNALGLILLASLTFLVSGYPFFRDRIPNGYHVPHPCAEGVIWKGVGHKNYLGSGERNVFGLDFHKNGMVWNSALCRKDSDGDGKTNGEELGDPDCTWTPGSNPKNTTGLTHPGVCQPLDSTLCGPKPSWVNCDVGFKCNATNEPETFNYTVRFPVTEVPARETTYMCMVFEFPAANESHLVATVPVITSNFMHHTLIYGCAGETTNTHPVGKLYDCTDSMDVCQEVIAGWVVGIDGVCYYHKMGFLIGGKNGVKYAVMQHHWNNPQKIAGYNDSSGMTFYLTPKLRPYNAGIMMIGQRSLRIPPGLPSYSRTGSCGGSCTSQIMNSSIYIAAVFHHMHLLGRVQHTELHRSGKTILSYNHSYDYYSPVGQSYPDPVMMLPGDDMATTCVFSSTNKNITTSYGLATSDEMCFSLLTYYPKENVFAAGCVAYRDFSYCETTIQRYLRGCDIKKRFNDSDPETRAMLTSVDYLCDPEFCREECLNYVKTLKKQPCFVGDVGDFVREMSVYYSQNLNDTIAWYARLDSCDTEIPGECPVSAGSAALPMMILSFAAALIIAMF